MILLIVFLVVLVVTRLGFMSAYVVVGDLGRISVLKIEVFRKKVIYLIVRCLFFRVGECSL